jgi:uncharacterized membrane protein HdeD (DUF308 family)
MSASPHLTLVVLLMASAVLSAGVARTAATRADARWTVVSSGLFGLACASLAALHPLGGG